MIRDLSTHHIARWKKTHFASPKFSSAELCMSPTVRRYLKTRCVKMIKIKRVYEKPTKEDGFRILIFLIKMNFGKNIFDSEIN